MLHVDIPDEADLAQLAAARQPGCVSIYVPASPSDHELGRIELKTLLSETVARLDHSDMARPQVEELHDRVAALVDDGGFWRYQANGLAVFAGTGVLRTFRLPEPPARTLEVADRFFLKPLLRSVTYPRTALVLALAQSSVRLIEVLPGTPPHDVVVPGLPTDIASSIGVPSIRGRAVPGTGRIRGSEGQKVRQAQFADAIDAALRPVLAGRTEPLILAAAEPMASIFRSANSYQRLATEILSGNPEDRSDSEVAEAAQAVLDRINAADLLALKATLADHLTSGLAVVELGDVARAATYGAVDTLLVDVDQTIRGEVDEDSGAIAFSAGSDSGGCDVVDEIARRALLTGARILALSAGEVPADGPCAAMLRYPT